MAIPNSLSSGSQNYSQIQPILDSIFSDAKSAHFFRSFYSFGDTIDVNYMATNAFFIKYGSMYDPDNLFLNLGPDATGLVDGVSGTDVNPTFRSTLVHELFHAMSITVLGGSDSHSLENVRYSEQLAVFAQNILGGSAERFGHRPGEIAGNAIAQSGIMATATSVDFRWDGGNGVFSFTDSAGVAERTYYRNVSFDGADIHNYVVTTRQSLNPIYSPYYGDPVTAALIGSSITWNGANSMSYAMTLAQSSRWEAQNLQTKLIGLFGSSHVQHFADNMPTNSTRISVVAAERFTHGGSGGNGIIDWSGPVDDSGANPMKFILIDQSPADTLLLGGSGYSSSTIDFTLASDMLRSGSGRDILLVGGGLGQHGPHQAWAGANDDILIGGARSDNLYGESGNDILVGTGGGDVLSGGSGFDIVDYSRMLTMPNDTLSGIEAIIGTPGADVFAQPDKMIYYGGEGNDMFILSDGDIAFGGPGSDIFYVTEGTVLIADLGSNDTLYINGVIYKGDRVTSTFARQYHDNGKSYDLVETITHSSSINPRTDTRVVGTVIKDSSGNTLSIQQDNTNPITDSRIHHESFIYGNSGFGRIDFDGGAVILGGATTQEFPLEFEYIRTTNINNDGKDLFAHSTPYPYDAPYVPSSTNPMWGTYSQIMEDFVPPAGFWI